MKRYHVAVYAALLAVCACLIWAGTSDAYTLVLPGKEARQSILDAGGHPHKCQRLSAQSFRCEATFWAERVEEFYEDGVLVETITKPARKEMICSVDIFSLSCHGDH